MSDEKIKKCIKSSIILFADASLVPKLNVKHFFPHEACFFSTKELWINYNTSTFHYVINLFNYAIFPLCSKTTVW